MVGLDRWGGRIHFVWCAPISLFVETASVVFAAGLLRVAADPVVLVWDRRRGGVATFVIVVLFYF